MRLAESIGRARELDLPNNPKYQRVNPGSSPLQWSGSPPQDADPPMNSTLLCPMPGVTVASDSLRQFYRKGIPQMRILPPNPL